ncbi:MAG TPA: hypothetical protein VIT44_10360 [Cyclobacteriaceae bacterium]
MSVPELKEKIINQLSKIEDELVLEEIYKSIQIETEADKLYVLSEKEKTAVEAGLKDIEAGKLYSSQEANEMIEKWLRK